MLGNTSLKESLEIDDAREYKCLSEVHVIEEHAKQCLFLPVGIRYSG